MIYILNVYFIFIQERGCVCVCRDRERGRARRRGRGRGWERERETPISCLLPAPQLGTDLTTRACVLMGNETSDPSFTGVYPSQLNHSGQGFPDTFNWKSLSMKSVCWHWWSWQWSREEVRFELGLGYYVNKQNWGKLQHKTCTQYIILQWVRHYMGKRNTEKTLNMSDE